MVWIVFVAIALALFISFIILIVFELKKNRGSISRALKFLFFTPANERKGIQGENFVNYFLKDLINEDEYLLTNILLPLRNGHKTEIDSVLISKKGIFCIEIKNWVGHISGDDQSDYWHQSYDDPRRKDKDHRNPVKQNQNHCLALERELNNDYIVKNIVLFRKLEDRTY